ncbi:AAA family ATPase [Siculibacillus lacustris]|uniref:AAA family ATPase n=1 Tax=Siculibacillus lacustris TaxID=1549641 RepID=A0A4Q9VZW3_9HYPH|nr:sigma 54-interacting transcriptional regulator [Siculibacillus lacustris]TBW41163.1 AAA family ATPase [Siculibacillus lacustris]
MVARVCLIAPYEDLSEVARSVGGDFDFDVTTANLEDALALLPRLEAEGRQVLISRGKTAQLLRQHTSLPVIDIRISAYDALAVLADLVGQPCRVAIVGHAEVMRHCKRIADQLGISAYAILFDQVEALEYERLQDVVRERLARDPIDVMIGDTIPLSRFSHLCDRFRLISSGPDSVREALESAMALLAAIDRERANRDHLCTVLDMFEKAVFSLDADGRITHANRTASSLFRKSRAEMMGMRIETVDPALVIAHDTIADGIWEVGQVVETAQGRMVSYLYPIAEDVGVRSMVLALERVERIYTIEQKIRHQEQQKSRFTAHHRLDGYVTSEPEMQARLDLLKRYARTDATVLITGESGTGKELLAQGIHNASPRVQGPFVAVNCGALPPTLLESELFGYVEGAFTGAARKGKKGLFELAHHGTLFLDEIGELDKSLQTRLLRVIQERELMRLGAEHAIPIDVRLVAATNQDLEAMVAAGSFRQDLYYRLAVLEFETLPLRERPRDIVPSALLLLRKFARLHHSVAVDLDPDLRRLLAGHDWPGNFRQLSNVIERIAIIASSAMVDLDGVAPALKELRRAPRRGTASDDDPLGGSMDDIRRRAVARVMQDEKGSKTRTARRLGVDRTTLNRWLKDAGESVGDDG